MQNKKKLPLPIIIIIIGAIIGLLVSGIGLYKQIDSKRINKERKESALKASQEAIDKANARLKEIEEEYYSLKEQYEKKQQECDSLSTSDSNWFANRSKCQREASNLNSQMSALEMEDTTIKNTDYTRYYQEVKPMSYQIFYIIGASILGVALLGAFIIYLVKGKKSY